MKFVILSDEFFYSFKPEGPSGLAAGLVPSITVHLKKNLFTYLTTEVVADATPITSSLGTQ